MAYATRQDAEDLYGETYVVTSVRRDAAGTPDLASFDAALDQASSLLDSYLANRYTTPVSPVPTVVRDACVDVAIYRASFQAGAALTEEKRQRYEDALAWLKDVSAAKAKLPITGSVTQAVEHLPQVNSQTRVFGRNLKVM